MAKEVKVGNVIRVAHTAIDALTDLDPSHYSLFSDSDNILIKEVVRGSGTFTGATIIVTHNLGYIPLFLFYGETVTGSNKYELMSNDSIFANWSTSIDTVKLSSVASTSNVKYKYFIFYDNFT